MNVEPISFADLKESTRRGIVGMLSKNRPYCRLLEKYKQAISTQNFVIRMQLKSQITEIEQQAMRTYLEIEEKRNHSVDAVENLLREKSDDDYRKYHNLMTKLAFLFDMVESTFQDINDHLGRCDIDLLMQNFPEMERAQRLASTMAGKDYVKMSEDEKELWEWESERMYKKMTERVEVYRRKVERKKVSNGEKNIKTTKR